MSPVVRLNGSRLVSSLPPVQFWPRSFFVKDSQFVGCRGFFVLFSPAVRWTAVVAAAATGEIRNYMHEGDRGAYAAAPAILFSAKCLVFVSISAEAKLMKCHLFVFVWQINFGARHQLIIVTVIVRIQHTRIFDSCSFFVVEIASTYLFAQYKGKYQSTKTIP